MFAFKFEVRTKKRPCKNKTVQQANGISINQSLKMLSTGTNTCPQPWPPLINGLVDYGTLCLNSAQTEINRCCFCKVVWRRYLGEVGKFYRTLWLIYP